jgi:hypothetical protein
MDEHTISPAGDPFHAAPHHDDQAERPHACRAPPRLHRRLGDDRPDGYRSRHGRRDGGVRPVPLPPLRRRLGAHAHSRFSCSARAGVQASLGLRPLRLAGSFLCVHKRCGRSADRKHLFVVGGALDRLPAGYAPNFA